MVATFFLRGILTLLDPGVVEKVKVNWVQFFHLDENLLKNQKALLCYRTIDETVVHVDDVVESLYVKPIME